MELLHNSTLKDVQSFATSLSFKPKGTKLDIIVEMLEISIPWIEFTNYNNGIPATSEAHPISASAQHLCLFDRFHERNAKRKEALRHVTNIMELKGKLDTQKGEQLDASYNHNSRYFNQMKPINHIFLFRSIIDIHNEKIN